MRLNKANQLSVLLITAAAFPWLASADEQKWIGGDQSAVQSSMEIAENWSGGVPLAPNLSADYSLTIAADGSKATFETGSTGYSMSGNLTLGDTDADPDVELVLTSPRLINDDSSATLRVFGRISILGAKTKLVINRGMIFSARGNDGILIDPDSSITGDGILSFGNGARVVPARDYDNLWLDLGQEYGSDAVYQLDGDICTGGRLLLRQRGTSGTAGRSVLDFNGHSASVGGLDLGLFDTRYGDDNPYEQSTFGALLLNGGTLEVSGSIVTLANPDGSSTWDGTYTPFVRDTYISTGGEGGTLKVSGSIDLKSRSSAEWFLNDLDFVLNGSGEVQTLEALQQDVGDTIFCLSSGYAYGSVTVKAGARVKLVDGFDNDRDSGQGAEAVYTKALTVEAGAELDLGGLNLYVYREPRISGSVVNGTVTHLQNAGFFSLDDNILGTPGTEIAMYGAVGGPIAAGDIDGDGKLELVAQTLNFNFSRDYAGGGEHGYYVMKYSEDNGFSNVSPFPVSDASALSGMNLFDRQSTAPFTLVNPGDGAGMRLFFAQDQYSDIKAIALADGVLSMSAYASNAHYGWSPTVYADIDGDGVKDVVTVGRNNNNVSVYSLAKNAYVFQKHIEANAGIVSFVGVADLDNDKRLEVMTVAKGEGSAYGLTVFRNDGSIYTSPAGVAFESVKLPYWVGERDGTLVAMDVTGDGVKEIFIADADTNTGNNCRGYLLVVNQKGEVVFTKHSLTNPWDEWGASVLFLDVDGDGVYEFLYDFNVYNGKFELIDTLPAPSPCTRVSTSLEPALADFNGDGIPEIVYGCADSTRDYGDAARQIVVYDPKAKSVLPGFPYALKFSQAKTYADDDPLVQEWHAGNWQRWHYASPVVADLDGDGRWEIAVGLGVGCDHTLVRPEINVINTPYFVQSKDGRTEEEIGWWQYGHTPALDRAFPLKKKHGLMVIIR